MPCWPTRAHPESAPISRGRLRLFPARLLRPLAKFFKSLLCIRVRRCCERPTVAESPACLFAKVRPCMVTRSALRLAFQINGRQRTTPSARGRDPPEPFPPTPPSCRVPADRKWIRRSTVEWPDTPSALLTVGPIPHGSADPCRSFRRRLAVQPHTRTRAIANIRRAAFPSRQSRRFLAKSRLRTCLRA